MKIKKKFTVAGIEFKITEVEEPYLNSNSTIKLLRVLAPNGKQLPIQIKTKESLKSIVERSTTMILSFQSQGTDLQKECF